MPAVDLDGGIRLSYSDQGHADGAVVLLPGPTDSWRSYEHVLASMPETLRVVAVSLRGHGESSKPTSGYRIEDLASDIVPFLDALDLGRVVLAGHSGSCLVARRIALDVPHRVAGLFLEASPTTLRADPTLTRFVDTVVAELAEPIDREFARSFVVDTSTEGLAPELVDRLVHDLLEVPLAVWKELFGSLLDYDDTGELSEVAAPTRLVWGDDDPLVPRAIQDQLVHLLPHAALTVYAGAGHTPRWEQPERFARELAEFASQVLRPRHRAPRHAIGPPSLDITAGDGTNNTTTTS